MDNNAIPEDLQKRIEHEAVKYSEVVTNNCHYPEDNWTTTEVAERESKHGYDAGATEYATKYHQARGFLETLAGLADWNAVPARQLINEIKSFLDGSK